MYVKYVTRHAVVVWTFLPNKNYRNLYYKGQAEQYFTSPSVLRTSSPIGAEVPCAQQSDATSPLEGTTVRDKFARKT